MLLKMGVDISKLEYHCRKALNTIQSVFTQMKLREPVITSTYEGTHSPGSLHYQHRAFDLRLPEVSLSAIIPKLKEALGSDFDVIGETSHIHIEFDPK